MMTANDLLADLLAGRISGTGNSPGYIRVAVAVKQQKTTDDVAVKSY
jgi:hypothetical protein